MQVRDLMTISVETVRENASLQEAAEKMKDADAGIIPVTNGEGQVVGVLTDRDIVMRAVAQGRNPQELHVSEVMSSDVVTCRPDCPVEDAVNTMRDRQIRRLVVTEERRKNTVGIVSLGDIATRTQETQLVGVATEGICEPVGEP
jgi:CBS domain-containing protein